jgi:hypothetical protein
MDSGDEAAPQKGDAQRFGHAGIDSNDCNSRLGKLAPTPTPQDERQQEGAAASGD